MLRPKLSSNKDDTAETEQRLGRRAKLSSNKDDTAETEQRLVRRAKFSNNKDDTAETELKRQVNSNTRKAAKIPIIMTNIPIVITASLA